MCFLLCTGATKRYQTWASSCDTRSHPCSPLGRTQSAGSVYGDPHVPGELSSMEARLTVPSLIRRATLLSYHRVHLLTRLDEGKPLTPQQSTGTSRSNMPTRTVDKERLMDLPAGYSGLPVPDVGIVACVLAFAPGAPSRNWHHPSQAQSGRLGTCSAALAIPTRSLHTSRDRVGAVRRGSLIVNVANSTWADINRRHC